MSEEGRPDARSVPDGALVDWIATAHRSGADAEAELCRRFAPRIRLFGWKHLRDEVAAADLVQDVLMTVLDRIRCGGLRDPAKIASYVLGTCRLMVFDRRREQTRRSALLDRFGDALASASAPERPRVDVDRLEGCLGGLPPRERAVMQLTFYADRSSEEIARELATTSGNVRVVRHRALGHLRACMGEEVGS